MVRNIAYIGACLIIASVLIPIVTYISMIIPGVTYNTPSDITGYVLREQTDYVGMNVAENVENRMLHTHVIYFDDAVTPEDLSFLNQLGSVRHVMERHNAVSITFFENFDIEENRIVCINNCSDEIIRMLYGGDKERGIRIQSISKHEQVYTLKLSVDGKSRYDTKSAISGAFGVGVYDDVWWNIYQVNANYAWDRHHNGTGKVVAILDSGLDVQHPEFIGRILWCTGYLPGLTGDCADDYGHGTHVTGIIGAGHNGFGMSGVAPNTYIYAIKVCGSDGSCSSDTIAQGLSSALDGPDGDPNTPEDAPDVINMSFGGSSRLGTIFEAELMRAKSMGVIVVASAGNEAVDELSYPAKYQECISVSAVDRNDLIASFSSYGEGLSITAPGVSIYSTISTTTGYRYGFMSGTSMSAPHVTGAFLLAKESFPNSNWDDLKSKVLDSCIILGSDGDRNMYGMGLVDACRSSVTQGDISCPESSGSTILRNSGSISKFIIFCRDLFAISMLLFIF